VFSSHVGEEAATSARFDLERAAGPDRHRDPAGDPAQDVPRQAFYIPSGSMENTLRLGDRVMVNKVVYHLRDIKRGDIVVFDGLDSFTPRCRSRADEPGGQGAGLVRRAGRLRSAVGEGLHQAGHRHPR
jgi:hypothetical protein